MIENFQRTRLATLGILGLVLLAGFLLGVLWDRRLAAAPLPVATRGPEGDGDGDRRL